jgi:hypothetical protein
VFNNKVNYRKFIDPEQEKTINQYFLRKINKTNRKKYRNFCDPKKKAKINFTKFSFHVIIKEKKRRNFSRFYGPVDSWMANEKLIT